MQEKLKYCKTLPHCDDSNILTKSLHDQINFIKSEIKSKNAIITMILMIIKRKWGRKNHQPIEKKTTLVMPVATTNINSRALENCQKWKKQKPINIFFWLNHFEILQDNIKENDHDLIKNYPIGNNCDSSQETLS